ncbi:MAG: hypothetical protein Q9157_000727 [Trypethelium eluteriae]
MSYTPPVAKDGFAFANDTFFAEATGHHRHRPAALLELQQLFHPSSSTTRTSADKESVGHWYEAQLLHYGLPPSKSKAVAKTRLLDAVNKGSLSVPEHIRKLEGELKKEWLKNERVARKSAKEQKTGVVRSDAKVDKGEPGRGKDAAMRKRKRDADGDTDGGALNINVSVNLGSNGLSAGESASAQRPKQTARRGGSKAADTESGKAPGRPKQTARRGGSGIAETGVGRSTTIPKQTARYSGPPRGAASTRGRATSTSRRSGGTIDTQHTGSTPRSSQDSPSSGSLRARGVSNATRVKHESDAEVDIKEEDYFKHEDSDIDNYEKYHDSDDNSEGDNDIDQSPSTQLGPLGLINGMYAINSNALDEWPDMFDADDFSLILCLEGNTIWGAYDFGMHSGILYLDSRPWTSSWDELPFSWRGRENSEGQMSFGPSNHGWIRFLGNGQIEGMINCYGDARFSGQRVSGNGETRAPRDARSMRIEWEGYNQRDYEVISNASPKNFKYVKRLGAVEVLDYQGTTVGDDLRNTFKGKAIAGGPDCDGGAGWKICMDVVHKTSGAKCTSTTKRGFSDPSPGPEGREYDWKTGYTKCKNVTLKHEHLQDIIDVAGRLDRYLDKLNEGFTED